MNKSIRTLLFTLCALVAPLAPAYGYSLTGLLTREALHAGMRQVEYHHTDRHYERHTEAAPVAADMSITQGKPNTACPQFQVYGFPETQDAKSLRRSFYTCRAGYAGMFDPEKETPLWVAEHLSRATINGGAQRKGKDFAEDPQIPHGAQGTRADYKRSGFDMGHNAPAADFRYSDGAMGQTFLLSNAVPQNPTHNRSIWANLEGSVREMADRRGELYVITGPIFSAQPQRIYEGRTVSSGKGIAIPAALYKVVVDPARKEMTAFIIPNNAEQGEDPARFQVSVRDVEKATGLNFNPTLSRAEADRQEVGGGQWLIPKVRVKFRD